MTIPRAESERVSRLDAQKHNKKGGVWLRLIAYPNARKPNAKAEREKAEREKAERYQLSERELNLIKMLSKSSQ